MLTVTTGDSSVNFSSSKALDVLPMELFATTFGEADSGIVRVTLPTSLDIRCVDLFFKASKFTLTLPILEFITDSLFIDAL